MLWMFYCGAPAQLCLLPALLTRAFGSPALGAAVALPGPAEPKPAVLGSLCVSVSQGAQDWMASAHLCQSPPEPGLVLFWRPMLISHDLEN